MTPKSRQDLQQWLESPEANNLRSILHARKAQAKAKTIEGLLKAVEDEQFSADAMEAAKEVVFYERVLDLLAKVRIGHTPDKPAEKFEYQTLGVITDQEPITT